MAVRRLADRIAAYRQRIGGRHSGEPNRSRRWHGRRRPKRKRCAAFAARSTGVFCRPELSRQGCARILPWIPPRRAASQARGCLLDSCCENRSFLPREPFQQSHRVLRPRQRRHLVAYPLRLPPIGRVAEYPSRRIPDWLRRSLPGRDHLADPKRRAALRIERLIRVDRDRYHRQAMTQRGGHRAEARVRDHQIALRQQEALRDIALDSLHTERRHQSQTGRRMREAEYGPDPLTKLLPGRCPINQGVCVLQEGIASAASTAGRVPLSRLPRRSSRRPGHDRPACCRCRHCPCCPCNCR